MTEEIAGRKELIEWFGSWPRFLDSEVLSIEMNRSGLSKIRIHTFAWTGKLKPDGHYLFHKHVIVTFLLEEIEDCELVGFNHQNVINGLELEQSENVYQLKMNSIFGVGGFVNARSIRLEFKPVVAEDSRYSETL